MNRILFSSIILMACLAVWAGGALGAEFCVSNETDLQAALYMAGANEEDDVIKLQQGTYRGNFSYTDWGNSITLLGGYASGCTERNLDPSNTVLDAEGSGSVLVLLDQNGGDMFLEGLTFQNGNTPYSGGGVFAESYSTSGTAGNIILTNNTVTGNTAGDYGGGIYALSYSSSGNSGDVTITNNTVTGNTAGRYAGGVRAYSQSDSGTSGNVVFTNNTIIGNSATNGGGGVDSFKNENIIDIYNNIIWGNTAPTGGDILLHGSGTANGYNNDYSDMSGSWDNSGGNTDENPLFVDGANGNYHLRSISPCIDAGTNAAPGLPSTDFEGDPRIVDGDDDGTETVDMGADEYVPFDDITLIVPNGKETLFPGSTYIIQWGAPPDAVRFKLKYSMDNGTTWKPIDSGITDTSYDWLVPTPKKNKKKCLVKVIGHSGKGKRLGADMSDSPFTIEVLTLTSPNGGEILTSGDQHTITWSTHATKRPVAKVILKYTKNGGKKWKKIDTLPEDTGTYDWTVPDVPKTKIKCKVKVVLKDARGNTVGSDTSDSYFTIEPAP